MNVDPLESLRRMGAAHSSSWLQGAAPPAPPRGGTPLDPATYRHGDGGAQRYVQNLLFLVMGLLGPGAARGGERFVPDARTPVRDLDAGGDPGASGPSEAERPIDMGAGRPQAVTRQDRRIAARLAEDFDLLVLAARRERVDLRLLSGYRRQADLMDIHHRSCPGHPVKLRLGSHESGNALDFANTPGAYRWLQDRARGYGLYVRDAAEPWHVEAERR